MIRLTPCLLTCRFGGWCRPAVPAERWASGQDSLQLVEEGPFLQTAGGLQNILAWVPQNLQAKPDLWVSLTLLLLQLLACVFERTLVLCVSNKALNVCTRRMSGEASVITYLSWSSFCLNIFFFCRSSSLDLFLQDKHPSNPSSAPQHVRCFA